MARRPKAVAPHQEQKAIPLALEPYWCMEEASFHAMRQAIEQGIQADWFDDIEEESRSYELKDGVAVITMSGAMSKRFSFWLWLFGGASTQAIGAAITAAADDDSCRAILLKVDSPGGSVAGVSELANAVLQAKSKKPVVAYAEDMCASAAYWVASQSDELLCNSTAMVGSIGTYMVISDYSKMAEDAGIKVHVIKAGEHKGSGVPGTKVTESHLAEFQRIVDATNDEFVKAVASGRDFDDDEARKMADGRVHVGQQAVEMGLADGVATAQEAFERALELSKNSQNSGVLGRQGEKTMAKENTEPKAETPVAEPTATAPVATQPTADVQAREDVSALKAEIENLRKANEQTAVALEAERHARKLEAAQKEGDECLSHVPGIAAEDRGNVVLFLKNGGDLGAKVLGALTATNENMKQSVTLKQIGSPVPISAGADVFSKVAARVSELRKADATLTETEATARVFNQDRALYEEYRAASN